MATLILELKGREIGRLPISAPEVFIGRDPSCDLSIENVGISRRHAVVRAVEGGFVVADAGSSNGTYVGGRRVTTHKLRHGDEIQLGKFRVRFSEIGGLHAGEIVESHRRQTAEYAHESPAQSGARGTVRLSATDVQHLLDSARAAAGGDGLETTAEISLPALMIENGAEGLSRRGRADDLDYRQLNRQLWIALAVSWAIIITLTVLYGLK